MTWCRGRERRRGTRGFRIGRRRRQRDVNPTWKKSDDSASRRTWSPDVEEEGGGCGKRIGKHKTRAQLTRRKKRPEEGGVSKVDNNQRTPLTSYEMATFPFKTSSLLAPDKPVFGRSLSVRLLTRRLDDRPGWGGGTLSVSVIRGTGGGGAEDAAAAATVRLPLETTGLLVNVAERGNAASSPFIRFVGVFTK